MSLVARVESCFAWVVVGTASEDLVLVGKLQATLGVATLQTATTAVVTMHQGHAAENMSCEFASFACSHLCGELARMIHTRVLKLLRNLGRT
jgi:hypothetical protein